MVRGGLEILRPSLLAALTGGAEENVSTVGPLGGDDVAGDLCGAILVACQLAWVVGMFLLRP